MRLAEAVILTISTVPHWLVIDLFQLTTPGGLVRVSLHECGTLASGGGEVPRHPRAATTPFFSARVPSGNARRQHPTPGRLSYFAKV